MARHLGDLPVFFWGQGYKGVPEVYLYALVFAVLGSGVMQMKVVTLSIWAVAVGATTRLGQRWWGDGPAVVAGILLGVGTMLVALWSLSANAEIAWLIGLVSLMFLRYQRYIDDRRDFPALLFFLCGATLWVHPVAIWSVATLAVIAFTQSLRFQRDGWRSVADVLRGAGLPLILRGVVLLIHVLIAITLLVFVATFFGARVSFPIHAAHPQKVLRVLAMLVAGVACVHALAGSFGTRRAGRLALMWMIAGLSPVVLFVARGGIPGAAILNTRVSDLRSILQPFVVDTVPMFVGLRDTATVWMGGARLLSLAFAWALLIGVGIGLVVCCRLFVSTRRSQVTTAEIVAPISFLVLLILLFPGGAYRDVQSTRYLMQWFGVAALGAAYGLTMVWRRSRIIAAALLVITAVGFISGQVRWYHELGVDESDRQVASCLIEHGIREATADYWIAYRLTFLAHEEVIVIPDDALADRYAPYRARVMAAPVRAHIVRTETVPPGAAVICTSNSLTAIR